MKYHINGAIVGGHVVTLIHGESGDDSLEFLTALIRRAFEIAKPVGGPIMWARLLHQGPMTEEQVHILIEPVITGQNLGYVLMAPDYLGRLVGVELIEKQCDCGRDEFLFVLNESLFQHCHGRSSEQLLQDIDARPWEKRIRASAIAKVQRGKEGLN